MFRREKFEIFQKKKEENLEIFRFSSRKREKSRKFTKLAEKTLVN